MEKKNSTEQAHKLTIELFGTAKEVREMAKTDREAHSYEEARTALREVVNKPLKSQSGLQATVSNNRVEKILSGKAVDKSFNRKAHFRAAANLEKLFSNAIEPFNFDKAAEKNNEHLKAIRRLYAPMAFNGRVVPVKFTIKEMDNERDGRRIYSLEAIDIDLDKKQGMPVKVSLKRKMQVSWPLAYPFGPSRKPLSHATAWIHPLLLV